MARDYRFPVIPPARIPHMTLPEADNLHRLLTRIMNDVRENVTLSSEVHRAEREFFQGNRKALTTDPAGLARFQEWFLLERESDVLGGVPHGLLPMSSLELESLSDSLLGVFLVGGSNTGEHVVVDLQNDITVDVTQIPGVSLKAGDLLIGRLYDGPFDVYIPSAAMAFQREGHGLAAAFTKDLHAMKLDRRLTQAEIEYLLFRSRGDVASAPTPDPTPAIPLEHLEADLEKCLGAGGVDVEELSATAISGSLCGIHRPGLIIDPLLEKIAFDTQVDIEVARALMLQIWEHGQTQAAKAAPPVLDVADAIAFESDIPQDIPPQRPKVGEAPASDSSSDVTEGLGAAIRAKLEAGMAQGEDLEQLFSEAEDSLDEPDSDADEGDVGGEGNLRSLITEYLWETDTDRNIDGHVLEQLVVTQNEAALPRLDLEDITITDLLRLLMQDYLSSAPGERASRVGSTFQVLERFLNWAEETQTFELQSVLTGVRDGFVQHVARLEAAGMALSQNSPAEGSGRSLYRVISVAPDRLEIAVDDGDDLIQIEVPGSGPENLQPEDLLLASVRSSNAGEGRFAGMVIPVPAITRNLLG
jgi:hypothetical protein